MKWTPWLLGSLTAALIAGCAGDRRSDETGATGGTLSDTMQGGTETAPERTATDTGMSQADTAGTRSGATGGTSADTARKTSGDTAPTSAPQ
jgi:hypothetical protein